MQLYPENQLFQKTIFWPLGAAAARNFYMHHRMANSCKLIPHRGCTKFGGTAPLKFGKAENV